MITPLLEKAIAQNRAEYSKYTHAMGMVSCFPIPKDKTVIIVDIKWNQFINPYTNTGAISVGEFLKYNEYQLKIDGKKSINYLTYRNLIFPYFPDASVPLKHSSVPMSALADRIFFQVGEPIIQDVYFVCTERIHVTVSRNAYANALASTYGTLNQVAAENNTPNGVQNMNLLKRLEMTSATPTTMFYTPPNNENAGLGNPAGGRNVETYQQDIDRDNGQIYAPDSGFTATLAKPYLTQPLVEFGLVTLNSNYFNELM